MASKPSVAFSLSKPCSLSGLERDCCVEDQPRGPACGPKVPEQRCGFTPRQVSGRRQRLREAGLNDAIAVRAGSSSQPPGCGYKTHSFDVDRLYWSRRARLLRSVCSRRCRWPRIGSRTTGGQVCPTAQPLRQRGYLLPICKIERVCVWFQ